MEPLFLIPIYKDYLWGGTKIKELFNRKIDKPKIAESWEICADEDNANIIVNGEFKQNNLTDLFNDLEKREIIFGKNCINMKKFPILIKFIDANKDLSIQVHPDDKYALENEKNLYGKNEVWYVIDCKKNAKLVAGINNTNNDPIEDIVNGKNIMNYLNYVSIKKGDSIYIPSGLVHAILSGTFICEIQQNCNLTYRVYDYDRRDSNGNLRPLHTKKAMDTIKMGQKISINEETTSLSQEIASNIYFKTKRICIDDIYNDVSSINSFYAINIIDGNGILIADNKKYDLMKGMSFIIPSKLGKYSIKGKMKILKTNV